MASFSYNPRTLRYRGPSGIIPDLQIRAALDRALSTAEARVEVVALQLRAREIAVSEFSVEMRTMIKDTQLYSAALASGGWAQMTPQLYGAVGRRIRDQYAYFNRFLGEIRSGAVLLDGNFVARAKLYALAGWPTMSAMKLLAARAAGKTQERNVRQEDQENCQGCITQTLRSWVPIGTLVPIGDRPCRNRDRCYIEYR